MGQVKEVLTMEDCCVGPVKAYCRPVSASHLDQITYFVNGTDPNTEHSA